MRRLRLLIELEYDDNVHGPDPEEEDWFLDLLMIDQLFLHSNEIGDTIGVVRVIEIEPH